MRESFGNEQRISQISVLKKWDLSSVGLERCFDRAEVMGSNPLGPTFLKLKALILIEFN